jgi:hypothetical protein
LPVAIAGGLQEPAEDVKIGLELREGEALDPPIAGIGHP